MRKQLLIILVFMTLLGFSGCSSDPAGWSDAKIDSWFEKGEWLNGWDIKPDESVNRRELAISYFRNRERWDKVFSFLKNNKLSALELKRYDIDGTDIYAPVSEYITKNPEDAKFEAHRKYIDIQYIISGTENIGLAPASMKLDVVTPYDEKNDIEFMTVKESSLLQATPDKFFIFFPSDLHQPSMKVNENAPVKKIVVKVKVN